MAEAIAFDIAAELIIKLSSRVLSQIGLWWNLKDDLDDLKSTVSSIKAVLLDAEERSVTSHLVKDWLEQLKDVLYDADDLLDDFSTETLRKDLMGGNKLTKEVRLFFSSSNHFAYGLKMGQKIKAIKARLASIESEANTFGFMVRDRPVETSFMIKKRQQTHSFVSKDKIIGRDDDKAALLKLMLEFESEENVYIIPVVGFGGLGKTALAQFVYNDKMVYDYFQLRLWVCVSDVFDVKLILENIIKSITGQVPDQNLEMDQLQKQLRDKIGGKKYLLVLDDIWNEEREEWVSLKELLVGGAKGSRIIVITRSFKVAKITSKCQPHVLKGLSDDDAWSLFKEIAFEQRYADSTNSAFVEIGKQILERCSGVPLVIRTIASTLSYKETEEEWRSFRDNELVRIPQNEGKILTTLKLSYDHLPSHLKHCFAYCRLYPKDLVIDVQTLVQFWIAQGFVKQLNQSQSLEEIGFGYFKDLVERSFLQEVEGMYRMKGLYWVKEQACKMHDLMHDLAETVAGMESSIVDSNKIASNVGKKCRHISIKPSLIPLFKGKKLRTLLHFPSMKAQNLSDETWDLIIANCRCLRALELNALNLKTIPRSIYKLKHLRYLDLTNNHGLKILPKSICKIQNLLVLKLDGCFQLEELPKKIENLVNLTHLAYRGCFGLTHMPRGIGKLTSLETLSRFVVDKDGSHDGADLSELSGLNNLREKLKIINLGFVKNAKEKFRAANLKEKQHLVSLVLKWNGGNDDDDKSLEDLQPHPNLKELCIRG
ncbi:putative disease resistance protein RGA3 [Gossypium arboreum]|uniref:putative disease resistance protein RGA3 n=1 Tax=Gossypium arboreum TaxID=29729 RepID=UPI0022F1C663|nr:putative disease resistance protein RGA3 [Gossypium arboreum]